MEKRRFTEEEKKFLLLLIEKHSNIVEKKETDSATLNEKRKAWSEIQSRFNSEPNHTKRTLYQLQKCWDNFKTKRKRKLTAAAKITIETDQLQKSTEQPGDIANAFVFSATNVEQQDSLGSNAVLLLSCGCEPNGNCKSTNDIFFPLKTSSITEKPIASALLSASSEAAETNVSSEENSYSQKPKSLTAQQRDINVELEAQLNKIRNISEIDDLQQIRKQEAEIRCQIALEELEQAKIHTETARREQDITITMPQQKLEFETKLYEMTLEKQKIEIDILIKCKNKCN